LCVYVDRSLQKPEISTLRLHEIISFRWRSISFPPVQASLQTTCTSGSSTHQLLYQIRASIRRSKEHPASSRILTISEDLNTRRYLKTQVDMLEVKVQVEIPSLANTYRDRNDICMVGCSVQRIFKTMQVSRVPSQSDKFLAMHPGVPLSGEGCSMADKVCGRCRNAVMYSCSCPRQTTHSRCGNFLRFTVRIRG
jgi:hypothetical protein